MHFHALHNKCNCSRPPNLILFIVPDASIEWNRICTIGTVWHFWAWILYTDVNIFAEVLSPQSIKITWNQFPLTDEEINGYTLSYKSLNSSVDNTTTATYFDARISFLIISELEEFVTYSFTLLPLSNREVITRSSTIQTTTWSDGEE